MEEFNMLDFIKFFFSKIAILIFFIILGLVGSFVYTFSIQVPVYKSETSLVLTKPESAGNTITQNDINLNKNLISTYREIIKSRRILSTVIENLDLSITYKELNKDVSVSNVRDTELILISVVNKDNELSKYIADEIARVFKREIVDIYNIENVSIVDQALISEEDSNVNVLMQFLIGVGASVVIAFLIIVIWFYFDDSIKSEEDIEKKIGLPSLGSIPKYKESR